MGKEPGGTCILEQSDRKLAAKMPDNAFLTPSKSDPLPPTPAGAFTSSRPKTWPFPQRIQHSGSSAATKNAFLKRGCPSAGTYGLLRSTPVYRGTPVYSGLLSTPGYSGLLWSTPVYCVPLWSTPGHSGSTPVYSGLLTGLLRLLRPTPVHSGLLQATLL
eukprot:gene11980-biopygen6417